MSVCVCGWVGGCVRACVWVWVRACVFVWLWVWMWVWVWVWVWVWMWVWVWVWVCGLFVTLCVTYNFDADAGPRFWPPVFAYHIPNILVH